MQPDPDAPTTRTVEYSTLILATHTRTRTSGDQGRARDCTEGSGRVVGPRGGTLRYSSRAAAGGLRGNRAKLLLYIL